MRTFKTLLLGSALVFSSVFYVNATELPTEPTSIAIEVGKLLKNPQFSIDQEQQVSVRITFNQDNEMVVLFVDSNNEMIKSYIKNRLNYKKLSEDILVQDKTYIVPVRITPEE